MDCVHPKGSKCSSGSLPTQPIVAQGSNAASQQTLTCSRLGRITSQQGKDQREAPKPFIETKPIGININPKLGKQEEG